MLICAVNKSPETRCMEMTNPLFFVTGSRWTILGSNRVQVTAAEKITNSMVAGRERSWNSTLRVPAYTESRGEEVQIVRMKVKHEAAMRSCIFWACLAWLTSWALGTRSALASSIMKIMFIGVWSAYLYTCYICFIPWYPAQAHFS